MQSEKEKKSQWRINLSLIFREALKSLSRDPKNLSSKALLVYNDLKNRRLNWSGVFEDYANIILNEAYNSLSENRNNLSQDEMETLDYLEVRDRSDCTIRSRLNRQLASWLLSRYKIELKQSGTDSNDKTLDAEPIEAKCGLDVEGFDLADTLNGESEEDKINQELATIKDQLLRTMAEYDNFRKRSAREKDALWAEIVTNVTSQFLPVLDNLERALQTECSDENYKKGVEMISNSFLETMKNLGVEEIESDGAVFDPNYHQAVQRVSDGDAESGTVVQTFAKGYKIGDRVIRFAVVVVKE